MTSAKAEGPAEPTACVLLSATLDLRRHFAGPLASIADRVEAFGPEDAPADVPMALAWRPGPGAFARHPGLRAVCSIAAGVDQLVARPDLAPQVDVVRVIDPDQARMMSLFVLWHVIGHQRRFDGYAQSQRERRWRRLGLRPAQDVSVGLLGYGQIGRRVARDLAALGFPVLAWSRSGEGGDGVGGFRGADGLAAMLAQTEVLVNLLPLTPQTAGLLDGALFRRMRPGGYLIQVGRGEHLVEADLLSALAGGALAGAALDVFGTEPLPPDHPFWAHPRIKVTPHEACDASGEALASTLAETAAALAEGRRPPNAVDRERGY